MRTGSSDPSPLPSMIQSCVLRDKSSPAFLLGTLVSLCPVWSIPELWGGGLGIAGLPREEAVGAPADGDARGPCRGPLTGLQVFSYVVLGLLILIFFFPKRDVYILNFIGLFLYDLCFESHLRTFSCCRSLSFFISSGSFIVCFPHLAY